jgi:hypothetical protein
VTCSVVTVRNFVLTQAVLKQRFLTEMCRTEQNFELMNLLCSLPFVKVTREKPNEIRMFYLCVCLCFVYACVSVLI